MEESQCVKTKIGGKSVTQVTVVPLQRWGITRVWLFLYSSLYFKHFLNKMCMTLKMVGRDSNWNENQTRKKSKEKVVSLDKLKGSARPADLVSMTMILWPQDGGNYMTWHIRLDPQAAAQWWSCPPPPSFENRLEVPVCFCITLQTSPPTVWLQCLILWSLNFPPVSPAHITPT